MKNGEKQKIPQEEHLVDVRKSANIGHLRDENHLIGVHLIEKGAPEEEEGCPPFYEMDAYEISHRCPKSG